MENTVFDMTYVSNFYFTFKKIQKSCFKTTVKSLKFKEPSNSWLSQTYYENNISFFAKTFGQVW